MVAVGLYAAAQPDPDRHRDARVGRQPRPAPAVRRQARRGSPPLSWAIGISLGRAGRHPAHAGHRARLLRPHPAGHQRVRRRDARPAQEPAADLRRRDGPRHPPVVRRGLPADRGQPGRAAGRRPGAVPVRRDHADAAGAAADRAGQGHRLRAAAVDAEVAGLGRRAAGPGRCCSSISYVQRQPAAGRHRRDVRDGDAVAGAADRLRRPRLAGAVHVRRRRRARLRQARRAQPLRAAAVAALDRRRGRRAGGAAGAAADRALPRAVDARLRAC